MNTELILFSQVKTESEDRQVTNAAWISL